MGMKRLLIIAALTALPLSAPAEEHKPAPLPDGLDELAEGMRNFLDGIQEDIAPLMEDLAGRLQGLNQYHPPEVLPNGDIIIRRKQPNAVPDGPETNATPPGDPIDI